MPAVAPRLASVSRPRALQPPTQRGDGRAARFRRRLAAVVLPLLLAAAGCGGSGSGSPSGGAATAPGSERPNVLRTADKRDPNTLDPALMWDTYDGQVGAFVHQGLVRFGEGTDVVPALAASWSASDQGTSLTFRLREARFHDGSPVTGWDVKYSVLRVLDPAVGSQRRWIYEPHLAGSAEVARGAAAAYAAAARPLRSAWAARVAAGGGPADAGGAGEALTGDLAGVVVEAPDTVTFHLGRPYLPFLTMLAMPNAAIIPLGAAEGDDSGGAAAPAFGQRPIGAGPWRLSAWTPGERLDFAPFAGYWEGPPRAEALVFRVMGEASTWRAEFEAGNLDFYLVSANDYREWRARPDRSAQMVTVPELNTYFLGFNTAKAPFDDARVRRALALATHRAEMLEYVALGRGTLAGGAVPPEIAGAGAGEGAEALRFDADAARALLAEAGVPAPAVSLYLTNDRHNMALMEVVKANWEAVGAKVTLRALDRAAMAEARRRGEHDVYFSNWWADYPDPDNFLYPLFHSANIGGSNGTGFTDREVDRLLDAARFEADPGRRAALYGEAEDRVLAAMPMIFLWHRSSTMAVAPDIEGYRPHPMLNGVDLHDVGRRTTK